MGANGLHQKAQQPRVHSPENPESMLLDEVVNNTPQPPMNQMEMMFQQMQNMTKQNMQAAEQNHERSVQRERDIHDERVLDQVAKLFETGKISGARIRRTRKDETQD